MSEQPLRLLLLDDEASLREPLAENLHRNYGYDVTPVADGDEALRLLEAMQGRYDVALIDEVLEEGPNGIEVLEQIKPKYPDIEVILFTGWGMESGLKALRAGAYRYFAKPFNLEELALTIRFAAEQGQTRRERKILAAFQQVSAAINSTLDLNEILRRTCQAAVELFGVDHSGVVEFDQDHVQGHVVAEYPAQGILGTVIPVRDVPAEERLVFSGEVLNIAEVASEPSLGPVREILMNFGIRSILIVPVIVKNRVIASFSLDAIRETHTFLPSEIEVCKSLANQVAVAIEGAELVKKLGGQNDYISRLITSSPIGVVANDAQGNVTAFNERAHEILGYTAEEMLNTPVARLYDDLEEARRIGKRLHQAADGKLTDYETCVRSKDGERIPVRVSVTWLYDAEEKRIGCVGYFEDLRSIKKYERRLALILKASNIVAQAENLTHGLQSLAEMIVTHLNPTFCRIFLLDESQQFLVAKAVYPIPSSGDGLDWNPGLEERTAVVEWPRMSEFLAQGAPVVLKIGGKGGGPILKKWSHRLGLKQDIQSLFVIPLRTKDRVVGLLDLGELRPWEQAPFSEEKKELASAIADQTAVLIDRMRLQELAERRKQLLTALVEASRHIRAVKETSKLLQEVVRLAAELVGCTAGGLYLNRPHLQELELIETSGLPENLRGSWLPHAEGVVGLVARMGKSKIVTEYSSWPDREAIFEPYEFTTVAAVPLKQASEVEAILFVADSAGSQQFTETDLEILGRFAAQASIALQTSRLLGREQRVFAQLAILHEISDYIQAAGDLEKILPVVLTGVTAGYGLGFNRAALLLLDERGEYLIGRMGIGYLNEREAREDWVRHQQSGLEDFRRFLEQLEQNTLPPTPIGERIRELRLPLKSANPNALSRAVLEGRYILVTSDELGELPDSFIQAFEPALPLVVIPLVARGKVIGLLVADNKFTHSPATHEAIELLLTFANTAAIAIDNTQLFHETEVSRERLRSFYKASNALVSSRDPGQVAQVIVEQARVAAGAPGVSMILIDEIDETVQIQDIITAGTDKDVRNIIRPHGLSMHVMRTGEPVTIEDANAERDRVNPTVFSRGIAAALGLPVSTEGKRIGIMWLHYDKPRRFAKSEIEALQLYVNQAAIAYDGARRIKELEHLRQAAEALAGAAVLRQVLKQIVQSALEVLQADSAFLWSYDAIHAKFIQEQSVAAGVSVEMWEEFRRERPRPGGAAYTVMERGWVSVSDIADALRYPFVNESTRKHLELIGARSFQGISLTVGDQRLGVLYVNYNRLRSFSEEEREIARTFANHAALALKNARLLEQVSKAKQVAEGVAKVTALGDRAATLSSVAQGTQEVVGCDAVTLYVYDQASGKLDYPPTLVGVLYPDRTRRLDAVASGSIVYVMLRRDEPYIVQNVVEDPLFKDRRFVQDEGIESCVAIPLKATGQKVGVMFVNYRSPHRFTADELNNIELFANQAAVAIRNVHLYQAQMQRVKELSGLNRISQIIGSLRNIQQVYRQVNESVAELANAEMCAVLLYDDVAEELVCQLPMYGVPDEIGQRYHIQMGIDSPVRTIWETQNYLTLNDVLQNPLVAELGLDRLAKEAGIRDTVLVKLTAGSRNIGIIQASNKKNRMIFTEDDAQLLCIFAGQAAAVIENARLYEELVSLLASSTSKPAVAVIDNARLYEMLREMYKGVKQIKGFVGSRTAVDWMRMVSTAWGHAVKRESGVAINYIELIRQSLTEHNMSQAREDLLKLTAVIERIEDIPITAPLSFEDKTVSVHINDLLKRHLERVRQHERYNTVLLEWNLQPDLDEVVSVRVSPEWLRRALEVLVDNAVNAMSEARRPTPRIEVATRIVEATIEIQIKDNGPGIPASIVPQVFLSPIEKPPGSRGAGLGLVQAKTIALTYGGDIWLERTGPDGTTVIIALPIEKKS